MSRMSIVFLLGGGLPEIKDIIRDFSLVCKGNALREEIMKNQKKIYKFLPKRDKIAYNKKYGPPAGSGKEDPRGRFPPVAAGKKENKGAMR